MVEEAMKRYRVTYERDESGWWVAAVRARLFDEAVALANRTPCDPKTLTRAARDFAEKNPAFAVEAGLAALRWIIHGYGYEITGADVWAAYSHTIKAAANVGGGTTSDTASSRSSTARVPAAGSSRGSSGGSWDSPDLLVARSCQEGSQCSARNTDAPTSRLRHAATSSGDKRHLAVCLAPLFDTDLDIVSESGEELHQARGGKRAGTTAHEIRDVRLRNTEDLPGLCLRQLPRFDGAENLQRQIRLQQLLVRVGQA